MFELALKILAAISFENFKGEVDIVVAAQKADIHITPPLDEARIKQIPESVKDHCKVFTDEDTTILMVTI